MGSNIRNQLKHILHNPISSAYFNLLFSSKHTVANRTYYYITILINIQIMSLLNRKWAVCPESSFEIKYVSISMISRTAIYFEFLNFDKNCATVYYLFGLRLKLKKKAQTICLAQQKHKHEIS